MAVKRRKWLPVLLAAGIPLATTVSCDPYSGALSLFRYADDYYYDHAYWDVFGDGPYVYYDDCSFDPCYNDYYYDDYYFVDY